MKNCLSLLVLLSSCFSSFSQVNFGLKGGGNLSNVAFEKKYSYDWDSRFGFHAGLFSNYRISNNFLLQAEAIYSMKGYKFSNDINARFDYELNLDYISIPMLCRYQIGSKLAVALGPQVSFLVLEKYKGDNTSSSRLFRKCDLGAIADISYTIDKGIGVGIRYDYGLSKVRKAYDPVTYDPVHAGSNRTLQVGIFYQIKKD